MKKNILGLSIIGILVVMLLTLTGCADNQNVENENNKNLSKLSEVVKVGDYVSYKTQAGNSYISKADKNGVKDQTFETTGNEIWKVLSIEDDGSINLVSADVIKTSANQVYSLKGGKGYINIIDELNNICKIYANGEKAVSARSIKYEDIYNLFGMDAIANELELDLNVYSTENDKWNAIYKKIAEKNAMFVNQLYFLEDVTIDTDAKYKPSNTSEGYEYDENLTVKNFWLDTFDLNQVNNSTDILKLAFPTDDNYGYWFANIGVQGTKSTPGYKNSQANYYVYVGSGKRVYKETLFSSINHSEKTYNSYIRPVVTLDKNTSVNGGTGTADTPYIIK